MRVQNGMQVYEAGEVVPGPDFPPDRSLGLAVYGYRLVGEPPNERWELGTEEDFRRSEAQRLGISAEKVEFMGCDQTGPKTCQDNFCSVGLTCQLVFNPAERYYFCSCR